MSRTEIPSRLGTKAKRPGVAGTLASVRASSAPAVVILVIVIAIMVTAYARVAVDSAEAGLRHQGNSKGRGAFIGHHD